MHVVPNGNFDACGAYTPAAAGFDLADVAAVTPFLHAPRVFGFCLMDDPDPRWHAGVARCAPARLCVGFARHNAGQVP